MVYGAETSNFFKILVHIGNFIGVSKLMVNQNSVHQIQNTNRSRSGRSQRGITSNLIWLLMILGLSAVAVEYFGVVNVVPSFGRGGRPMLDLGIWRLSDVSKDFWASQFINGLVKRDVISGYPNDEFRPEQSVTRAEFAAMLESAFPQQSNQTTVTYKDVSSDFWANSAINKASERGFFQGSPQGEFLPNQPMSRVNALVALAKGLKLESKSPTDKVLVVYKDASQIPAYARDAIAAATEAGLVVNYPDQQFLNPNQSMTRADAAAFIYQALVHKDQAAKVDSAYIVGGS